MVNKRSLNRRIGLSHTASDNRSFPLEIFDVEGFVAVNRACVYISLHFGCRCELENCPEYGWYVE